MFGKIREFVKPLFGKSDNMPAQPASTIRRVGEDDYQQGKQQGRNAPRKPDEPDDFFQDKTVFSLAAIRAGLMEGAGSISEDDLARGAGLLDRLAMCGVRGVPVADGQGLIAALEEAEKKLKEGR